MTIDTAMVLAAGLGLRMRPLTASIPKALVRVGERALIDRVIDRLTAAGVSRIVVNAHYRAELLRAHLALRRDVEILISDESGGLLDTGGALVRARGLIGDGPLIVHNCDTLWIEGMGRNLPRLIAQFDAGTMDALLMLAPIVSALGYEGFGDFEMDAEGRLTRREEMTLAPFAFTGVQVIHPRVLDGAPPGPFSLNRVYDAAIAAGRLCGMRLDGLWMHVGTPDAVGEAEAAMAAVTADP